MFNKGPGGVLYPASDLEAERMNRFKTGDSYQVDIKLARNGKFHSKVFTFFNFCFEHWSNPNPHQSAQASFDLFRKQLTILAGYHNSLIGIDGSLIVEAKSISYTNMTQEEFEMLYSSLINAAMDNLFKGANQNTHAQLMSFF